jgi:hypothetical protein
MDKIRFELHVPQEVTLQSAGKIVDGQYGQQTMYRLQDGRVMYLDLAVSQKLNVLDVQPGETVGICKRGKGVWDVWLSAATEQMRSARGDRNQLERQLSGSITEANERRYGTLSVPKIGPQPVNGSGAGATNTRPDAAPATVNHQNGLNNTRHSNSLVDEANALVDAYAAVLARALDLHQGRIKPDEVRSIVLSAYIQQGKAAKYAAA